MKSNRSDRIAADCSGKWSQESDQGAKTDVGYEIPSWNNWSPLAKFYHPLQAGSIDGTDTVPHDRAVTRAMVAKYKPNKRVSGDPDSTLFVGKLSKETSEATLYKVFTKCGELTKCKIVRDVVTGFSKGYAFVEYRSDRDAIAAWREIHNEEIDGCTILVEYEAARVLKGWIPRRLGGGLGGKKESGQLRFGGRDRPFRRPIPGQQGENQHKYLRGSRDHEVGRFAHENPRDTYRERKKQQRP
ncbi:small nuclear ribonucleoprotein 35kDa (U11 U12) [Desmophyllum pertusum]|uniref:U11/U12 small nuclear ribonucleoprotein 35 kDa protein n=1 Tax=Desmophyllum pertusum TaxID=174260 RepID=A0A9W9YD43_9CNID|nr:small nuclear ribonucleoprotein 35kDa (U11 U12) [Desmophyllum pertusum]